MNTKYVAPFLTLFCAIALVACTKHPGDRMEPLPAGTITFASPTQNAVYKTGDSVLIQGLAVGAHVMHGYDIAIKDATDTSVIYFSAHSHDHNDTLYINQTWKNTLANSTNLQLAVTVTLDHDGSTLTKTMAFRTTN